MAQGAALVEALKRALKARGLTYAQVASGLAMSEASVKRMFSRRDFTLKRIERICDLASVELAELARSIEGGERLISQLTRQQEREIIADRKLTLVALCAMNGWTLAQIVAAYSLTEAECIRLLLRLDKLKIIRLLPGNRIRLLLSRTFSWLPDGPIQQYFKVQAQDDYFRSRFNRPDEQMLFVSGRLSAASRSAMIARLRRVASEFSELHNEDSRLPFQERAGMSMLVAIRPWELPAFHDLRRKSET